jgi:hypothetical protein
MELGQLVILLWISTSISDSMKLLLLCQTQDDVNALPIVAEQIRPSGVKDLWILCSPSVGMDVTKVSAEKDAEILALDKAEKDSAARGDYDAAKEFRGRKDAAVLEKQASIADAWRNDTELTARQKVSKTADHYETSNWINLINSVKGSWAPTFQHGGYAMSWVRNFPNGNMMRKEYGEPMTEADVEIGVKVPTYKPTPAPKPAKPKAEAPKYYTGEELEAMKHFGFMSVAKKYGVYTKDEPKLETIKRILDKQVLAKQAA